MDKELKILVDRLSRIFPHLKLYEEGHYFDEENFAPPVDCTWYDIVQKLKENGLEIKKISS